MKRNFEELKSELEKRIESKQRILISKTAKESEQKAKARQLAELRNQEMLLDEKLQTNTTQSKLLKFLKHYALTRPVETVFHVGALLMLIQQEWLPFIFCLIFPFFVPMLMQKKKRIENDKR